MSFGTTWSGSDTTAIDVVQTQRQDEKISGPGSDYVDHGYDQIELFLNPRINATSYADGRVEWSLDFSSIVPQVVLVGWLNGSQVMPADVQARLASYGVTAADYPQMLAADPYASDPAGTAVPDSNRFSLYSVYPYEPLANQYTDTLSSSYTVTNTSVSEHSYTVGASVSGLLPLKVSNQFTFTNSASRKSTSGSTSTETLMLGMPSSAYTGPTNVYVYIDKVYKTFLFSVR